MDKKKAERCVSRGAARWFASRLKPVVKKLGVTNIPKPKGKAKGRIGKKKAEVQ
ncbi:MAG: hypothetical protein AAB964_02565 [Patescibacteria group bacterium]